MPAASFRAEALSSNMYEDDSRISFKSELPASAFQFLLKRCCGQQLALCNKRRQENNSEHYRNISLFEAFVSHQVLITNFVTFA